MIHQGLLGNFAMRTRWQTHRYVLRQSMEFYQNDFAGRIAQKVLQTSLAVRDVVMKVTEVLLYVAVYFTGALVLFAASDLRLSAPLVVWFLCYLAALRYFVPRLERVSMEQADARSVVTGRIVDSYTNIPPSRCSPMPSARTFMRARAWRACSTRSTARCGWSTLLTLTLNTLNSMLLFCGVGVVDLAVVRRCHHRRRHRLFHRPGAAHAGHGALDHVGGLGAVREYRRGA